MDQLVNYLRGHPPRCLAQVAASLLALRKSQDNDVTSFALAQKCSGIAAAAALAYRLKDYNPECADERHFISPLKLRWPDAEENLIYDSDIHGYHGEMGSSASYRGQGEPVAIACSECDHDQFIVTVQFEYWGACRDLWEDEPELPIQDYFCGITVFGMCQHCGTRNALLAMD